MGKIYTFRPKFPQADCHLCGKHYKNIFAHTKGIGHKLKLQEFLKWKKHPLKPLTLDDYFEFTLNDYETISKDLEPLKAMSIDELRKIVSKLEESEPRTIILPVLNYYKAWLCYYESLNEGKVVKKCSEHSTPYVNKRQTENIEKTNTLKK
jgi:hypothetical protein